jgi:hypothetical protein
VVAAERRRIAWSLTIGAVLALACLGWSCWSAAKAEATLRKSLDECEAALRAKPYKSYAAALQMMHAHPGWRDLDEFARKRLRDDARKIYACDLSDLGEFDFDLSDIQTRIMKASQEAKSDRHDGQFAALVIFGLFCLPLVWYFLLDRLREVSAAIRNP